MSVHSRNRQQQTATRNSSLQPQTVERQSCGCLKYDVPPPYEVNYSGFTLIGLLFICYNLSMTKIAIIEDDPTINQMYRMKFEASGFEVELADNGKRGVALVESFNPDIILLDIQMPEMNGAEALEIIRKNPTAKTTPVIILTNMGEEESPTNIKHLGVHSYIVKADVTPSQVVQRVKEALGTS